MADLSKLELTDSTLVTLKDNSQANSDHRHYEKDIVPLVHKVYESTSYYATATTWEASSWFFASVIPDSWYLPWKIKFRIHSYCPYNSTYESITEAMLTGRSNGMSYANWNETQTAAHYYTIWYPLKKAGFDAGYGHAIGVSIYGASNYTNASYYRTFEIDLIECENCTITFLDTPVLWSNWSGTGSTYYESRTTGNAYSRGLQETGDNDTAVHNRITYFAGTTGNKGIWANSLFMEDAFGNYQDICTAADGTVTANSRTTATTKKANTNGFKVLGSIWYINTTYNSNTQISGSGVVYSAYGLVDARYSFNVILSTTSLIPYKEIYLCGTIGDDGLFYLDQNQWWTQTPTDGSKIYVLIGAVYDSTASNVRFTLYEQNKWYRYDGTNLIEIANEAISATSLAGTPRVLNQESYLFRSTPNGVGNFELDSIVGGTVASNQLIEPKAASSGTSATVQYTHDGNGNLTLSGTPTSGITLPITSTYPTYINGHKYFIKGCPKGGANATYSLRYNSNGYGETGAGAIITAVTGTASNRQIKVGTNYPLAFIAQGQATNFTYTPIVIDLTQMFGSTIADYIDTLETTTARAGVAYFCKLFPKTYYPYTAGELISVKTSKHITKGFNQFDKTTSSDWQNWYINASVITAHTYCKSAVIPCIPNTTYYAKHEFGARLVVGSFPNYPQVGDVSTNPAVSMGTGDVIYTTGACDKYLVVWFYNSQVDTDYSAQDVADVLVVNISSYRNGEYESYVKHEYDLDDDLELRGIPLLGVDNKLYYDGDTYSSDGTVNRKYFKYTVTGAETLYVANTRYIKSDACDAYFNLNTIEPIVSTALPNTYCKSNVLEMRTPSSGIWSSTGFPNCGALNNAGDNVQVHINIANSLLGITDYTQETTTTVKTKIAAYLSSLYQANKPIEFIFKLKTETTETAGTFTNPQEVDQYGTEEYVDTRTVSMPVGHSTIYYSYDDRSKLDSLPDPASADGTYAISQTNGKQTLVPTSSISVGDAQTVNSHTVNADVPSTAVFTDEKVTQTATSDNKRYEVLFSGTNDNTTRTEGTRKSSDLLFNPSRKELSLGNYSVSISKETNTSDLPCGKISLFDTISDPFIGSIGVETIQLDGESGNIHATSLNGATIGNNPAFTDTTYSLTQDAADGHILTLTPSSGTAQSVTVPDTMVTQTLTSTDANYPILFAKTTISTTTVDNTNTARRNNSMYVNPSTGNLQITQLNGVTVGNNPEFTDTQSDWNASSGKAQILNKPTLGTASAKDVPVSGNASTTQVVMGDDTRLTDARTPSSHTHGNIANGGTISSTAVTPASSDYILISDTSNSSKIERGIELGSDTTKYLRNDGTWQTPTISAALSDLSDVTIDNPSGGQTVVYDGDSDTWVNGDYTITSLNGNVLEPNTVPSGAISTEYTNTINTTINNTATTITNNYTAADTALAESFNTTITQNVTQINSDITSLQNQVTNLSSMITSQVIGGINKISNSSGLNGIDSNWTVSGSVSAVQDSIAQDKTLSGSMFVLAGAASPNQAQLSQVIKVIRGQTYTFTLKACRTTASQCYVDLIGSEATVHVFNATSVADWQEYSVTVTASGDAITVKAYAAGENLYIADLMFVEGDTKLSWSPAPNEIYTEHVKIDKNGVKVESSADTVVFSTSELSVYNGDTSNPDNKVFNVDDDKTTMTEAEVLNSLQIGRGKFIAVADGVNFVLLD